MSRRIICLCNLIEEKEINAILEKGAESTKDIQMYTRAGTSCGRCLPQIDELVEKHKKKQNENNIQGKLNLGF